MAKKGQAAMEFLMTYGWAILVVLVVIGALAYFGVLNPAKLLPDKCVATAGVSCPDYKITTATVDVKVVNGLGSSVTIKKDVFSSPDTANTCTVTGLILNDVWVAGESKTLTATCAAATFTEGNKARGTFTITYYTTDSDFTHDVIVEVAATVQQA